MTDQHLAASGPSSEPVAPPERVIHEQFSRARPALTARNSDYWTRGAAGELVIRQCTNCGLLMHPPSPICLRCRGRAVVAFAVSGRGRVHSFTVSRYQWVAGLVPPYVVALVELEEQPGLFILTNIIDVDPGLVAEGDAVEVCFAANDGHFIPLFRPIASP